MLTVNLNMHCLHLHQKHQFEKGLLTCCLCWWQKIENPIESRPFTLLALFLPSLSFLPEAAEKITVLFYQFINKNTEVTLEPKDDHNNVQVGILNTKASVMTLTDNCKGRWPKYLNVPCCYIQISKNRSEEWGTCSVKLK